GEVEIVRYSVVDDVGTVINPLLLKGQIVGGVAQGIGQVLMEDIKFDGDGQNLTGSFMDYAMPRATDISAVDGQSNPVPTKTNPLGVKGAGEAGCVGAMPAVANALVDALSHLGIRHVEMPATPERLWRAMRDAMRSDIGASLERSSVHSRESGNPGATDERKRISSPCARLLVKGGTHR